MITKQQIIEIGEVRCSIGFENGFFQNEFDLLMNDYRRWGFCSEEKPDIHITVKNNLILQPSKNNHIFYHSMEYDSVYATMIFDTDKFEGEIGFIIKQNEKMTIIRIIELIETFICNAYIFYFGLKKMGTFIHSCGIAEGENGYIFAGPSGYGKSTIANLSHPRTILCDEIILLKSNGNGKKQMFGSPFIGESESINKGFICKGIYFIEQGSTNEIIPISRMTSAITLLKEGIMGNFMSIEGINNIFSHSNYLSLLIDLLEGVPCYRLKFKKDNTFWKHINEQQ